MEYMRNILSRRSVRGCDKKEERSKIRISCLERPAIYGSIRYLACFEFHDKRLQLAFPQLMTKEQNVDGIDIHRLESVLTKFRRWKVSIAADSLLAKTRPTRSSSAVCFLSAQVN